jgi:hypothetical protein
MALDGTWKIFMINPQGVQEERGTDTFITTGSTLTGSATERNGVTLNIENGIIDGDKFSFTISTETPMGNITATITGILDGDKISGNCILPKATIPYKGIRV